jgi:FkbM family methyltransferase
MLISLSDIVEKYDMNIRGVVHVGAHKGQEIPEYLAMGAEKIICFEPLEENYIHLLKWRQDGVFPFKCALGDKPGVATMNISTNDMQSSSLLNPKLHLEAHKDVLFTSKRYVEVKTLEMFRDQIVECNLLNMDVQGFEYEVLVGASDLVGQFDYVYCEVNSAETYENNKLITDIDDLLREFDFIRVETWWATDIWGDALYIKKDLVSDSFL